MGVNLQKKAQKSFKQHIDTALEEPSNGDLFDEPPASCPRQFLAEPSHGAPLQPGDKIDLELKGDAIIGTRGADTVLRSDNSPAEIIEHVKAKSVIAEARVSKLNPLSGTVEVHLC